MICSFTLIFWQIKKYAIIDFYIGGCMSKKVFAFDLGKASIGYCVREDHDIKVANSIIIEKDHAEAVTNRNRRRINRTLLAHKAREDFFNKIWQDCGLTPLNKNDLRFTKEFANKNEETIYTSCLLRIALLQNKKLENWQIYKALHNAIQRRGYDPELAWKSVQTDDDKLNMELIQKYSQENGVEIIKSEEYKYPCYYDAKRLGLWNESKPNEFSRIIPLGNCSKVRTTEFVAPRKFIESELKQLWLNAQKQIPSLLKYSVEEFLYGEYREAYGSYVNPDYRKFMGTTHDWQGVLGQKIPRFDNRIISKCKLLPKRNVCKANTIENVAITLLLKLKNLRVTGLDGDKIMLSPEEILKIFENWKIKSEEKGKLDASITKAEIEKVISLKIIDKIEPMKANISGRSSFCRRACLILTKVILSGEANPVDMDISEFIDPEGTVNGITEAEIKQMLSKIGTWNNLYIPDNRGENIDSNEDVLLKTDTMIGEITNPIVRNRLQIFRNLLLILAKKYGKPDEVIFEFVRDKADNSLYGREKAQNFEAEIKRNEKNNELIKKELEDANALNGTNFEKLKLLKIQGGKSVYSGENIAIADFEKCEIDHIYPRSMGGNDALYNKVLCYREENQEKRERTPYEWLSKDDNKWDIYVQRLSKIKEQLGKKKFELLTSNPSDCAKLIDSYNGLAETSHIARVAQQITAFVFNWGLQVKNEKRYIFVNNGLSTSLIRKRYKLNSLLGDDIKKNRENDKHHALDAICISYSRDFKYDESSKKDVIQGFNPENVKKVIDEIIPYPYANKKQFKGNVMPLETIYGKRIIDKKTYITNRVNLENIKKDIKKIRNIVDETIKNDLTEKAKENYSDKEWLELLKNYIHPKKQTKVKKVLITVSEGILEKDSNGRERIGEYVDFGTKGTYGQFKCSKGHKGQILYFNEKGSVKVMPVYSNIKMQDIKEKLAQMNCKLYKNGLRFYSGCLLNIPNDFKAGAKIYPKGVYKLRTARLDGVIMLETACGEALNTSAQNLVSADFSKLN